MSTWSCHVVWGNFVIRVKRFMVTLIDVVCMTILCRDTDPLVIS